MGVSHRFIFKPLLAVSVRLVCIPFVAKFCPSTPQRTTHVSPSNSCLWGERSQERQQGAAPLFQVNLWLWLKMHWRVLEWVKHASSRRKGTRRRRITWRCQVSWCWRIQTRDLLYSHCTVFFTSYCRSCIVSPKQFSFCIIWPATLQPVSFYKKWFNVVKEKIRHSHHRLFNSFSLTGLGKRRVISLGGLICTKNEDRPV